MPLIRIVTGKTIDFYSTTCYNQAYSYSIKVGASPYSAVNEL